MKKMLYVTVLGCMAVLLQTPAMSQSAGADEPMNNDSFADSIQKFEALDAKGRTSLVESNRVRLERVRGLLLDKLLSKDEEVRFFAAYLLGQYRFPEAVDALAKSIALLDDRPRFAERLWDRFPAMEALVRVGSPSLLAMIRNLEQSDDPTVTELSLKVLYRIDGEKEIAQFRLKKAFAAQQDSKKKARLESALGILLDPKFRK